MFFLMPILINEQKNRLRLIRRQLRDNIDPFTIPEERFYEMYRMPPVLAIKLVEEFRPYIDDTDDIPLHLQILTALNFYASGSYQRRVGSDALCCVSQSKVSLTISKISRVGYRYLSRKYIRFPTTNDEIKETKKRFEEKYNFPGIIGLIDCTHLYVVGLKQNIEYGYVNRKKGHSINTQIICNADLVITSINPRYSGGTHDALIWQSSKVFSFLEEKYAVDELNDTWYGSLYFVFATGDGGYPLQPFLMIPVTPATNSKERAFNRKQRSIRSAVERCILHLKGRFRCLMRERLLRYSHTKIGHIATTCAVIHNFLIKNYYDITDVPLAQEVNDPVEPLADFPNIYLELGTEVRENLIQRLF